jgi:Arc/MetJ-type ribon-helix-helix transcriptional regulator
MSGKRRTTKKSATQLTLKDQLLGSEVAERFFEDRRDVSVTLRMNSRVVELLDALVELEIFESRSEAISDIVESAISAKHEVFVSLKVEADVLKRRRAEAKEMASRVIGGDIKKS